MEKNYIITHQKNNSSPIRIPMLTNELLIKKYKTQKRLDNEANHNLTQYVSDGHTRVKLLAIKLGLSLEYGQPNQPVQKSSNLTS